VSESKNKLYWRFSWTNVYLSDLNRFQVLLKLRPQVDRNVQLPDIFFFVLTCITPPWTCCTSYNDWFYHCFLFLCITLLQLYFLFTVCYIPSYSQPCSLNSNKFIETPTWPVFAAISTKNLVMISVFSCDSAMTSNMQTMCASQTCKKWIYIITSQTPSAKSCFKFSKNDWLSASC